MEEGYQDRDQKGNIDRVTHLEQIRVVTRVTHTEGELHNRVTQTVHKKVIKPVFLTKNKRFMNPGLPTKNK